MIKVLHMELCLCLTYAKIVSYSNTTKWKNIFLTDIELSNCWHWRAVRWLCNYLEFKTVVLKVNNRQSWCLLLVASMCNNDFKFCAGPSMCEQCRGDSRAFHLVLQNVEIEVDFFYSNSFDAAATKLSSLRTKKSTILNTILSCFLNLLPLW